MIYFRIFSFFHPIFPFLFRTKSEKTEHRAEKPITPEPSRRKNLRNARQEIGRKKESRHAPQAIAKNVFSKRRSGRLTSRPGCGIIMMQRRTVCSKANVAFAASSGGENETPFSPDRFFEPDGSHGSPCGAEISSRRKWSTTWIKETLLPTVWACLSKG